MSLKRVYTVIMNASFQYNVRKTSLEDRYYF